MLEAAIEAGADDVHSDANGHLVACAFESAAVSVARFALVTRSDSCETLSNAVERDASCSAAMARVRRVSASRTDTAPLRTRSSKRRLSVFARTDSAFAARMAVCAARTFAAARPSSASRLVSAA